MLNKIFNVEKMPFIDNFFEYVSYESIKDNNEYIILDLRTSKEFNYKSIVPSTHLSLLDDEKSIKIEEMYSREKYFSTFFVSIYYIIPNLIRIRKTIKYYEKNFKVVLACRHARMRSRCIGMFVNIFGCKVLVLKGGVNPILGIDKKDKYKILY